MTLTQGTVVDGRFEVERLLGEGGLAAVYLVRHTGLGSLHALKLLTWRKKALAERLILEGRIQAQLNHPNIVAVTDLVRHDGQLGLLMEFVDQASLEERLDAHGGFGLDGGLELVAPILSAVAAAHALGVTHRDLKPANILLASTPRGLVPKVTDFGIAKVMADLAGGSTAAGSTMGTPGYLAPEQVEDSSSIDARADVFALGAITWELITGRRAFADEEGNCSVLSTTRREVAPLSRYVEGVPDSVQEAIDRALMKDPTQRFQDCASFAEALFAERQDLLLVALGGRTGTGELSLGGIRKTLEDSLVQAPAAAPSLSEPTLIPPPADTGPPEEGASSLAPRLLAGLALVGGLMGLVGGLGLYLGSPQPASTSPVAAPVPALTEPVPEPTPPPVNPTVAPTPAPVLPAPVAVPEPSVPEPTPTPVPSVPSEVLPAPAAPAPAPAPVEPAPTEAVPEPAPVQPEPVELPAPEPTVAEPVPAPAPAPVVASIPTVGGTWTGRAARLPLELTLVQGEGGQLTGRAVFTVPPRPREEALSGTVSADGSVRFQAADLQFVGRLSGSTLSGTYRKDGGGKQLDWSVSR